MANTARLCQGKILRIDVINIKKKVNVNFLFQVEGKGKGFT